MWPHRALGQTHDDIQQQLSSEGSCSPVDLHSPAQYLTHNWMIIVLGDGEGEGEAMMM